MSAVRRDGLFTWSLFLRRRTSGLAIFPTRPSSASDRKRFRCTWDGYGADGRHEGDRAQDKVQCAGGGGERRIAVSKLNICSE